MPPNMGLLGALNSILPYVGDVVISVVAFVIFIWYTRKYMPEISRTFTKAYHSRGLPAFIQDEMGGVGLYIANKKLPEGVIYIPNKGWFLLPNPPNPEDEFVELEPGADPAKRGVGRPPKDPAERTRQLNEMSAAEKKEYAVAHGMLVQTPILKGFGKQVFFGSSVSAPLSNLTAIAHAELPKVRLLGPRMYQKTQLDALATGSRIEGYKMASKEVTKLLMYAIICAVPLGVTGLIVYLLTSHSSSLVLMLI